MSTLIPIRNGFSFAAQFLIYMRSTLQPPGSQRFFAINGHTFPRAHTFETDDDGDGVTYHLRAMNFYSPDDGPPEIRERNLFRRAAHDAADRVNSVKRGLPVRSQSI